MQRDGWGHDRRRSKRRDSRIASPAGDPLCMTNDQTAAKGLAAAPGSGLPDGLPWERRRWAVAAIFTALAMASLDTAIANIALPAISSDLHVSPAEVIWVVNVYQIALVATLLA